MSVGDFGAGIGGGGAVAAVLYTIHLLRPYFRKPTEGAFRGDSPRAIRDLIQEQRDKEIMEHLRRGEKNQENDHREMMIVLREIRDSVRNRASQ